MSYPISEPWMHWQPISTAPLNGEQILVGFKGQDKWYSYVAAAHGSGTGEGMPFALPTHWTLIVPPPGESI